MEKDLEKEIKEEENMFAGDTPTPNQDASNPVEDDNDDFSEEDLEKELSETDNDGSENEDTPTNVEENNEPKNEPLDEEQPTSENENSNQEKLLTQSQVNELVGKARKEGRESAMKDLMIRYGVSDENELNDIFGRGQAYDDLDYDYQNQGKSFKDAMAENALLKSHISENRWDDVKAVLAYKGLDITPENIAAELPTHSEWSGANNLGAGIAEPNQLLTKDMAEQMSANQFDVNNNVPPKKPGVLKKLGNEPTPSNREKTDDEIAAEMYGYKSW